jgi:hypothetical protein
MTIKGKIMSAKIDKVYTSNCEYKTPVITRFKRTMDKVIEVWRAITSSFESLFLYFKGFNRIQRGALLKSGDLLENVRDSKLKNVSYLDSQVLTQTIDEENLPDAIEELEKENKNILILPYTVKKTFRDHIVLFAVNVKTKEILFYDSKGWTIKDYNSTDMNKAYNLLKEKYSDYTLVQNTRKEQYDTFNCGVYVMLKIKDLEKNPNASFKNILAKTYSYRDAMKIRRSMKESSDKNREYMKKIEKNASKTEIENNFGII